ncbi:MAG: DUF2853 family protein [Campylobacterales bacterium]|nr:DUF2853 family protein [Campylobacterales bacterium]
MSQKEEKIALYIANAAELGLGLSDELISKVTGGLGPSIYNADSETVACTQGSELETIKTNFLINKLGIYASDEAMYAAIKAACEKMGNSNRNKYRALVYALLVKEFNKEYVYN